MDHRLMSVDWEAYEIYQSGVSASLDTVSPAEARRAYKRLMEAKQARINMLRRLLNVNGVVLQQGDSSIQALNEWFDARVEPDPENPGRLTEEWYSLAGDIGLFLGDVIIERHPTLRWELFKWGRKNVSFQRAVIMGFTQVINPKYNIDFPGGVVTHGHRIVAKRGSVSTYGVVNIRGAQIDVDAIAELHRNDEIPTDSFWQWLRNAESKA